MSVIEIVILSGAKNLIHISKSLTKIENACHAGLVPASSIEKKAGLAHLEIERSEISSRK